jgi:hypothetical protein
MGHVLGAASEKEQQDLGSKVHSSMHSFLAAAIFFSSSLNLVLSDMFSVFLFLSAVVAFLSAAFLLLSCYKAVSIRASCFLNLDTFLCSSACSYGF